MKTWMFYTNVILFVAGFTTFANAQTALDRFEQSNTRGIAIRYGQNLIEYSRLFDQLENQLGSAVVADRVADSLSEKLLKQVENDISKIDSISVDVATNTIEQINTLAQRSGNPTLIRTLREIESNSGLSRDPRSQIVAIYREFNKDTLRSNIIKLLAHHDNKVSRVFYDTGRRLIRGDDEVGIFDFFGTSRGLWNWAKENSEIDDRAPRWLGSALTVLLGTPFTLTFDLITFPFILVGKTWVAMEDLLTTSDEEKALAKERGEWAEERRQLHDRLRKLEEQLGRTDSTESGTYNK